MKKLATILLVLTIVGCASQKPLRSVEYIADGWILAAYDKKTDVYVHARQEKPVPYTVDALLNKNSVLLSRWAVRYVNSGTKTVCVKVNYIQMDYDIKIQNGWYILPTFSTKYVGYLQQQPWVHKETVYAFNDASWAVNTLEVVSYDNETNTCNIKKKTK